MVVAMAAALVAFEMKSYDKEDKEQVVRQASEEIEDIVIQTQELELPPPPPPETPEVTTEFEVVEDDAELTNELGPVNAEVDESTQNIEITPVVVEDDAEIKNELIVNAEVTEETQNIEITPVKIEEEEEEEDVQIFTVVENDPEFPGGMEALYKYLRENIKYPQLARDNNITGKVYVTFVVERDGSIANPRVLKDIGGGCGAEAIRVVKAMPKWTPGKQRGKAVRVQFNLPVSFNLQ